MKKFLFTIAALAMVFAGCTPEEELDKTSATISFVASSPSVEGLEATFAINVNDYAGTDAVTVPFVVETEAVEGTDYEISATEFVWGGENPVTSVVVTTLKRGTDLSLKLTLQIPEGFAAGEYTFSEMVLADKEFGVSFESSLILTESDFLIVNVVTTDASGEFEVEEDVEFTVTVNEEESTAVEGEHFDFSDGAYAYVPEGSSIGELYLDIYEFEEGKDKIVLRLEETDDFGYGNFFEVEIRLVSYWEKFAGKWVINEYVTTKEYFESTQGWCQWFGWNEAEQYAQLPVFNAEDAFEITIADATTGKLIPDFKSNLKNYFIGETNITKDEPFDVILSTTIVPPPMVGARLVKCDNINRFFSATEMSEDKEGLVALRIFYDDELGEELLDVYIVDHTSHSFLTGILTIDDDYDYGLSYEDTKPTAPLAGWFINATFKRVTE